MAVLQEDNKNLCSDLALVLGGFEEHKKAAQDLVTSILPHSLWFHDRAAKMAQCGTFIRLQEPEQGGALRLVAGNLCRVRLCPMCEWRLSMRRFIALDAAAKYLANSVAWLHVVLTVPNVDGAELAETITGLYKRSAAFFRSAAPVDWLGWYRGLEVSYNALRDDYHPHLHCLVAVRPGYFSGRHYMSQARLQELWGGIAYISRLRDLGKGIAECCKYACKPLQLSAALMPERAAAVYDVLAAALHGRRLVQTSGVVREALRACGMLQKLESEEQQTDRTDRSRPFFEYYWNYVENTYKKCGKV